MKVYGKLQNLWVVKRLVLGFQLSDMSIIILSFLMAKVRVIGAIDFFWSTNKMGYLPTYIHVQKKTRYLFTYFKFRPFGDEWEYYAFAHIPRFINIHTPSRTLYRLLITPYSNRYFCFISLIFLKEKKGTIRRTN